MFEKIKGIKIKSGIFEDETKLELFEGKYDGTNQTQNDRASLLFGRNGSGKSTIARGIHQLKIGEGGEDRVSFIDRDDTDIILKDVNQDSIFVFNEDYVDQKVKIAQDGLDTIVILGEQVDIDSKIDLLKEQLSGLQAEFQKYESEFADYSNNKNEKSPDYWKDKITASLKGVGHWAERDREIKGNRAASSVNSSTFQNFVNLRPTLEKKKLEVEFNEKKERYFSLRDSAVAINQKLSFPHISYDSNALASLLSKRIEKPELNSRDRYLLELLSDSEKGELHLREVKDFFSDEHNKVCPFCTQSVLEDVKEELTSGISKLLSKAVEEHQEALRRSKLDVIEQDLSDYEQLDSRLIQTYQNSIKALNTKFEEINIVIDKKIKNPYVIVELPNIDFSQELIKVKSDIEIINQAIIAHNVEISDIQKLKESLLQINNELAFYEIKNDYENFRKKITEKNACRDNYNI
ncbi:AAA family ATPase [Streptococcus sp. ZJ100]